MQSDHEKLIQVLTGTIECLKQQNDQQQKLIIQNDQQISGLSQEILSLRKTIECLRHKIFGASSEKTGSLEEKPEIIDIFNEAEASADPSAKEPDAETMVGGYIRKKF